MKYDADTYEDLQSRIKIDRGMLDEEVIAQASNYFHVSEGYAMAVSRRDAQKHNLEVQVAELDRDVRDSMVSEGEKVTEALVKAQITREPDFHRSHSAYLSACLEADRWEALRNAYRQRADMLKSLVQLHQSGYFGEVTGAAERQDAISRRDYRETRRR